MMEGGGRLGVLLRRERAWGQKLSVQVSGDQMGGVGPEQERRVRWSPQAPTPPSEPSIAQNMGHSQVSVHSTGQKSLFTEETDDAP